MPCKNTVRHARTWRIASCLVAAIALVTFLSAAPAAFAGPGHDHGHNGQEKTQPEAPASPRVVAQSERFELVAILKDASLTIYLDRLADTSPVTDARIELTVDGETGTAQPDPEKGTYTFTTPALANPGEKAVVITIETQTADDLLIGSLSPTSTHTNNHTHRHGHTGTSHTHEDNDGANTTEQNPGAAFVKAITQNPFLLAGIALAIGLGAGMLISTRLTRVAPLVALIILANPDIAFSGPGHDHSDGHGGTAPQMSGDAPHRRPDGNLFLPKPTQRLLEIRTLILQQATARTTTALIGHVIADPNHSGLVQSTVGGRFKVTDAGLPVLGSRVKANQILGYIEPAFEPIDASDVRQTGGEIDQRIAVLQARIAITEDLIRKGIYTRARLLEFKAELEGLEARKKHLQQSTVEREALVAPTDGVIADIHVAPGQVVTKTDTLFHVVDPTRFFVEAISFDPAIAQDTTSATAQTPSGEPLNLTFVGRSRTLQRQAIILQFRIEKPPASLNIGTPLRILIETGASLKGLIIPREAVVQAPNGQTVVFKRIGPENYRPEPVRVEKIDTERVLVHAGLSEGDQIIVRNASLVNQIR